MSFWRSLSGRSGGDQGKIEEFFWAALVFKAMPTAGDREKSRLQRRFATECGQYVALKFGEMTNQPTGQTYRGSSDEFLAECVEKARAIRDELR